MALRGAPETWPGIGAGVFDTPMEALLVSSGSGGAAVGVKMRTRSFFAFADDRPCGKLRFFVIDISSLPNLHALGIIHDTKRADKIAGLQSRVATVIDIG
jgi:hypothetical protein